MIKLNTSKQIYSVKKTYIKQLNIKDLMDAKINTTKNKTLYITTQTTKAFELNTTIALLLWINLDVKQSKLNNNSFIKKHLNTCLLLLL